MQWEMRHADARNPHAASSLGDGGGVRLFGTVVVRSACVRVGRSAAKPDIFQLAHANSVPQPLITLGGRYRKTRFF
eukprot:4738365-Prymnesium_polylepis.1